MYKLRFKEWGLEKNIKSDEAKAMLAIRKRRREELSTETEFVLRGRVVTDVKLDRFQKRLKIDVESLTTENKYDVQKMGLEYRTPKVVSHNDSDVDDDETLDSSVQDDGLDGSCNSTPKPHDSLSPTSDQETDAESLGRSISHIPSALDISLRRLEIIHNVFKQIKAISIDRTCRDILIPAMAAGDDELIRVILRGEITESTSGNPILENLLHLAVVHGRIALISLILEKGADVNSPPPGAASSLHQAVLHHRSTTMIDLLLKANASIDATDKTGRTALGLAVSLGKSGLVKSLASAGADVDYSLSPSLPPLYEAMLITKNTDIFQLLKSHGALTCTPETCRLDRMISEEWIPFSHVFLTHSCHGICKFNILHKACELGKVEDVSSLFSDLSFLTPPQARETLSLALANKYSDLAKSLITMDVGNLNETVSKGKSALELAVDIGDAGLVSLVMAKTKSSLYPLALLMAVHLQNFAVAKLLLDAGTSQTDTLLQYPLTVAAQNGNNDLVSLLLRHRADPNHQNQYGMRPLELAVDWGRDTTAEILIQAGAVPSANLLANAIRNRLVRLASHLLTHCSADPNQICPDTGLSPLQEEASKRDPNYDLVTLLLRFGADIYQTSPWQTTAPSPLLKAIRERNTLLVKTLLDNHKCNRLRCRRELPVVLREADPLLLSDVQDSTTGHDTRLWRPDELEDMDIDGRLDAHMDLDAHGHTGLDDNLGPSGNADTQALHHNASHAHTQSLESSGFGHQHSHHGHYDPGQHHNPMDPHASTHGHGHQSQNVAPVIDFRTMTTIYPYWNPILLGVIPPHTQH
ncbi:ankyrin repeat-containing domain protein [Zalerion maritima]|uniref:Ankyrin repeat-containing domain protein n=1 Tax=Zalerion maritima TaxID=339359 RepID=A0AAD5RWL8_9PEZI|nr:ankyrin repeat-containing domain protein [Zalerion maritima]